ncbi:EamA family transporter [Treponema brennaborense]|nr:EamA family transporter [Treponema brennaborense]
MLMHTGFLLYSFYTVLGKTAAGYPFLSKTYCILYVLVLFVLFLYAVLWQQVLKHIVLSVATANKAVTVIWGMLWSFIFFQETITIKKMLGAGIIITGIILLARSERTRSE